MRSALQQVLLASLVQILRPIASLMLKCGVGFSEFTAVAKTVFVEVATEEYGIRGRPTNSSRIAAMTGMSRKEVKRLRDSVSVERWTPDMESTPANSVIHYWHYDPDFAVAPGKPRSLPLTGNYSFQTLVSRYAGDIPSGAIRKELVRARTVIENDDGTLIPWKRYHCPSNFHEDFVRNVAFALGNLGNTILHNADLIREEETTPFEDSSRRFERSAWTERLHPAKIEAFKTWVHREGAEFIERADHWIGGEELPKDLWKLHEPRTVGVGLYYFEET
jgi:hypothetical protein